MKSLLNALEEGRLVELPDMDKGKALQYLAHLLEAVPDLSGMPDLYEAMLVRENAQNTALGLGVACPHVRAPGSGEIFCAVGWSPSGIDYGAPDSKKVHLVVMYYIPESHKNVYLKEISGLAAAVRKEGGIASIAAAQDIATVRERLLDWVSTAIEASIPEAKARMIRLEARQAAVEALPAVPAGALDVTTALFVTVNGSRPVVLCQNPELAAALDKADGLGEKLKAQAQFDLGRYKLVCRSSTPYGMGRSLYEYLAIKTA